MIYGTAMHRRPVYGQDEPMSDQGLHGRPASSSKRVSAWCFQRGPGLGKNRDVISGGKT